MGIGLSNGAYYDDEHHYAAAKWDDKYDNNELDPEINDLHTEDNNIQSPPSRVEKSTTPQPVAYVDPNDMTNQYNTKLTPEEQADYNKKFSPGDSYDYDMQGWYKANPGADPKGEGVHYPDTFKKPNHPTFSDQSQYHSDDTPGGHWDQLEDGSYTFAPGATNLKYHDKNELTDYFSKVEPTNKLLLPPDIEDRRDQTYSLKDQWNDGQVGRKLKDIFLGNQTPAVPEAPVTPMSKALGHEDIKLEKSVSQRSALQQAVDSAVDSGNFIRGMLGKPKIDPSNFDIPEDTDLKEIAKLHDKLFLDK